jgi:hypothetical protein
MKATMAAISRYLTTSLKYEMFSGSFQTGSPPSLLSTAVKGALAIDSVSPRSLLKPIASRTSSLICFISGSGIALVIGLPALSTSLR